MDTRTEFHGKDERERQEPLPALPVIRKEIDRVDGEIRTLFQERMALAKQVACIKAQNDDRIYKPEREALILEKQTKDIDGQILMEYRALLRRMMEISRKYQYGLTLQMRDCFPFSFQENEKPSGSMAMLREELYICDFRSKDTIRTAVSFDEIGGWIRDGLVEEGAGIIERIGTGVSDALNAALMRYDLSICECRVITCGNEKLKVVTFSKDLVVRQDHNRLKFVFTTPNRSGALGSILSMIADYGCNLTEIHSIPYRTGEDWNYRFFVELDANLLAQEIKALVFQLSQETLDMKLLGSYRCVGDFVQ